MENIWNERNLRAPPMQTYPIARENCESFVKLSTTLKETYLFLKKQQPLYEALELCRRIKFLRNTQFRTQHGFQNLRKVLTAYERYSSLNFPSTIDNMSKSIQIDSFSNFCHLPTRETFEFLLVRYQGVSKLMVRLVFCTKEAAIHFTRLLSLGFFVELNTLLLAMLGQIWCSARDLCKEIVKSYGKIYKFHKKLKMNRQWLPENYDLPKNLAEWLGDDDWNNEIMIENTNSNSDDMKKIGISLSSIQMKDDVVEMEEEIVEIKPNDEQPLNKINKLFNQSLEIGTEVKRKDFQLTLSNQKPMKRKHGNVNEKKKNKLKM